MGLIRLPLRLLSKLNSFLLTIGSVIATLALAFMVAFVIYQIVMRYAFNTAPAWTEEGARFLMLWMTGLVAPLGYRKGGFVAIDLVQTALPRLLSAILSLILLALAMLTLIYAFIIGWSEITGFAGRFATASIYFPWPGAEGLEWIRAPRSYMMASLVVGSVLMISVNIELILRVLAGEGLPSETSVLLDKSKQPVMEGE
ncbi:MAG: TRAP transporter small permease subunit [Hyphomicrobiales bacterium]